MQRSRLEDGGALLGPYFELREDDRDSARERYEDFCDAPRTRRCKACDGTGAPRPQDRDKALRLVVLQLVDCLVRQLIANRRKVDPDLDDRLQVPCQYSAFHLEWKSRLQPRVERAVRRQPEKHDLLIGFLVSSYEEAVEPDDDGDEPLCNCGRCQWS